MPKLHLLSPRGFKAGAARAGIKSTRALDVAILVCEVPASVAAVFTTNKVVSAAVTIGRGHIAGGKLRGVVVNAGNANACTGRRGELDARRMCDLAASAVGCEGNEMLPSSTGIIGHHLPMDKIQSGITQAAKNLGDSLAHARQYSDAILTTDTRRKMTATRFRAGREWITIAGVCKGSGMIGPRLAPHATMLAYLTTDAKISPPLLRRILAETADVSFNAVTVDDQTSTNDTAAVLASGLGATIASRGLIKSFTAAMKEVCQTLAYKIAEDGEGATKVVEITVRGAGGQADANLMARAIANSPLVKCAMNGNDPNWGRILVAAGLCGAAFDAGRAELSLQNTVVFKSGRPMPFHAPAVSRSLAAKKVVVDLNCRLGKSSATVWTCDLSKDYVTINADYHT
ncbi:MAG TPA: bifunctional glutamate N-acetyltransferase/amino-acid acetyltransferase ArgJ [Tepidisphaeraceae bacterium]|jgi:glutamate N-acetyltransferase/amino-acid N-acetyltransferase|nr:bifunctional glutamate N-acetyltransferase/amino-acid acetyltransferase ArgJ [Tepidisphaeraceae bacterium]